MARLVGSCIASVRGAFAILLVVSFSLPFSVNAQNGKPHADRILVNGIFWTGDDTHPRAEAIAISGDKLLAVGTNEEIRALAVADTAVVDLKGRLVVPGFQDSHLHFPGASVNSVRLEGIETLDAFQKQLTEFAKAHQNLPWIKGGGWGYSAFPNQTVDKKYIDAVISDRPVYVSERDGHMGLANSKALQLAGITRVTPDPPNGHIMRDAKGEPTGELKESAQELVYSKIPPQSEEETYQTFLQHMEEAAADGRPKTSRFSNGRLLRTR